MTGPHGDTNLLEHLQQQARKAEPQPECACYWLPEEQWLSAASCGYGSGYEPGSQLEPNPHCLLHFPKAVAA